MFLPHLKRHRKQKKRSTPDEKRPGSIWRGQGRQQDEREGGPLRCLRLRKLLTGNGAQVQVVPDHLLELMVQGALLKLQAEVVTQISIQHLTWGKRQERSVHQRNHVGGTHLPNMRADGDH